MKPFALAALLVCASQLLGCPEGDPGTCSYNGRVYRVGDTFAASDGCNTCSCTAGGAITCTERACLADGGSGDIVMCTGATPTFPSFDKTCAGATDCTIGLHQINCCGSMKAIGINQAEKTRFDADEKLCESQYPGCGCAAAPTVAEDGHSEDAGKTIVVECQVGKCMTLVK